MINTAGYNTMSLDIVKLVTRAGQALSASRVREKEICLCMHKIRPSFNLLARALSAIKTRNTSVQLRQEVELVSAGTVAM